jgi:hypothetical protein
MSIQGHFTEGLRGRRNFFTLREGTRTTRCFQAAPMFSPTRHNVYTGPYSVMSGVYPNNPSRLTILEIIYHETTSIPSVRIAWIVAATAGIHATARDCRSRKKQQQVKCSRRPDSQCRGLTSLDSRGTTLPGKESCRYASSASSPFLAFLGLTAHVLRLQPSGRRIAFRLTRSKRSQSFLLSTQA